MTDRRALLNRAAAGGLVLLLAVLGVNAAVTYRNTAALADSAARVDHTRVVMLELRELRALLVDAETGQRGYLLTGDDAYRRHYRAAVDALPGRLDRAAERTADNPAQQAEIGRLRDGLAGWRRRMDEAVALGPDADPAARRAPLDRGRQETDDLRAVLVDMEAHEQLLLDARAGRTRAAYRQTVVGLVVATAVAAAVLVGAFVVVRRGLAAHRRYEEETRETDRFVRLLLDSTGEGIYGIDRAGHCTFVNAAGARLFGYDPAELLGKNVHALTHHTRPDGTLYPAAECPIHLASRDRLRGVRVVDELFWRRDGTPFPVEYTANAVKEDRSVLGAVVTFNDITARKKADDDLRQAKDEAEAASRAKGTFLANMSHELRTPLNAVILYSELLEEEAEDRGIDDFLPDLGKIKTAGRHLLSLINTVLDLSKIEAGKMDVYLETFAVADAVAEVESTVRPLVEKKGNTLAVRLPADAGEMHADLTKVRQVLFNLLSNAAKFAENGAVALTVERRPAGGRDGVAFVVSDTGIGMTAEQVAGLFRPFAQADASTTRKFGGTGLGLTLVKRFCEMMGGSVRVESEPGTGTTVTAWLPAAVTPSLDSTREAAALPAAEPPADAPAVLVVDDEPTARELLSRVLGREGFRVRVAADGRAGLEAAAADRPDVILLDVMMPRMDGWAVLAALKADPRLADIPVVMHTMVDDRNLGFALGAAEYLTKPVDRDRLVAALGKYRGRRPAGPVLVIEDEPDIRAAVRRALEHAGWRVAEAANGRDGLAALERERPAAVLLDLMMPEMDGFGVLDAMRERPDWHDIPVVVVTAKDLSADDRRRLNGHVERVIQKGAFGRDDLLREVRRLVGVVASKMTNDPPMTHQ